MRRPALILGLIQLLAATPLAAEIATVEGVRGAIWLKGDGDREALAPETAIRAGEVIATAAYGGARLELEDGSRLRMAGGSRLELDRRGEEGGHLALHLDRGQIQYTARLGGVAAPLSAALGEVKAELTGADAIVRRHGPTVAVVLLAGEVVLKPGDDERHRHSDPYRIYRWQPGSGLSRTELGEAAARRLAEGMALPGTGMRVAGGPWVAQLASLRDADVAAELAAGLRDTGLQIEVTSWRGGEGLWHRVVVPGFATEGDARRFAEAAAERREVNEPWVRRR